MIHDGTGSVSAAAAAAHSFLLQLRVHIKNTFHDLIGPCTLWLSFIPCTDVMWYLPISLYSSHLGGWSVLYRRGAT